MSTPECRICLETKGTLISVCKCKGYSGYVHAECIEKWIRESGRDHCEICQEEFQTTTKHVTSEYCCNLFLKNMLSRPVPLDLQSKQLECSTFLVLSQIILYLIHGYGSYIVVTLIISFMTCFITLSVFCTCSYESRFYVQNFALRLVFILMIVRFVFVTLAYMDMNTIYNSCTNCISIMDRCSWTCKEDLEYGKKIISQLDSIVYHSLFLVGTFIVIKVVADGIISSKVTKVKSNQSESENATEIENEPLITEV